MYFSFFLGIVFNVKLYVLGDTILCKYVQILNKNDNKYKYIIMYITNWIQYSINFFKIKQ